MSGTETAAAAGAACASRLALERLVAGELAPASADLLERHAAGCARCRANLAEMREAFAAWPAGVDAQALWAEVEKSLGRLGAPSAFLDGIDGAARERLMQSCRIRELGIGEDLIRERDTDLEMYVILDGTFDVLAGGLHLDVRRPGDLVGEIAFLTDGRRTATVRAGTAARVLVVRDSFLESFAVHDTRAGHRLVLNLARIVAGRFAEKMRAFAGAKDGEPVGA